MWLQRMRGHRQQNHGYCVFLCVCVCGGLSQRGVAVGKYLLQPQGYVTASTYMLGVYITPRSALTNTTLQQRVFVAFPQVCQEDGPKKRLKTTGRKRQTKHVRLCRELYPQSEYIQYLKAAAYHI